MSVFTDDLMDARARSGGVIGLDPGRSSGAIAYAWGPGRAVAWKLEDLTDRDIWELVRLLAEMAIGAVLERVSAMPGQGVSSTFKFGSSYGELKMALVASNIRYEQKTPGQWQRAMNCLSGGKKNVTKARAQQLFPNVRMTNRIADAILLAEFGRTIGRREFE